MMKTRRDFLTHLAAGATLPLFPRPSRADEERNDTPNIVLIMADDLGYGDLGCYGNEEIKTPNIDALAAGGVRFTDFHSNAPVCSPTRAALLTGRYQQRCGIEGVITAKDYRHTGMALEETTFAEALKPAGYATALFGKWHLGYKVEFNPAKQGFDEFRGYVSGNVDYRSHYDLMGIEDWWDGIEKAPEEGYVTDLIANHGVRFIEKNKDKPFCLYLAHEAPHFPYQGRNDPADRGPGKGKPGHGSREDRKGAYKEMIEAMDEGVGRIVKKVRELGLEKDTFIFFCSDNGATELGSNGRLRGSKGSLWEGGIRVPAIAYWPGRIEPNRVSAETVLSMDLFPTLLSIAGAAPSEKARLDGADLLPSWVTGASPPERTLFWRFNKQRAVRRGPWKLRVEKRDDASNREYQLFNLDDDLAESHDLSQSHPEKVKELTSELEAWEKEVTAGVERRT
jgi:arylsulfatase A-like enzyme